MPAIKSTRNSLLFSTLWLLILAACFDQRAAVAAGLEADDEENCATCGEIVSITAVTEEGDSTGVGAVLGAIAGGIAGNQVGGGSGKKIATVAGVVGGAVAGDALEKNRNTEQMHDVRIEMENGSERTIRVPDATGISVGSDVKVEGNQIYLR